MHFLKIYDKLQQFSPFAGCTKDQQIKTEISQGGVGSYLCHQDMELIDFRKALLQLKWSTDFISGTRWNFEGKPGSHTLQILTNK